MKYNVGDLVVIRAASDMMIDGNRYSLLDADEHLGKICQIMEIYQGAYWLDIRCTLRAADDLMEFANNAYLFSEDQLELVYAK